MFRLKLEKPKTVSDNRITLPFYTDELVSEHSYHRLADKMATVDTNLLITTSLFVKLL